MDKKNFIQQWILNRRPSSVEQEIKLACEAYNAIEGALKTERKTDQDNGEEKYESRKGAVITGEKLKWFEAIWAAWNIDIKAGDRGGKKEAADAFLANITNKEQATRAYKEAKRHSTHIRPELEKKGHTAPYFPLWMNEGRWDTDTQDNGVLAAEEPQKADIGRIRELQQEIAHTKKSAVFLKEKGHTELYEEALRRCEKFEQELNQLVGDKAHE